jgi:hypothetical protein
VGRVQPKTEQRKNLFREGDLERARMSSIRLCRDSKDLTIRIVAIFLGKLTVFPEDALDRYMR